MENSTSSANGGIIAQYGFHYQKIAFIYYILSTFSVTNTYIYEGIDDIEIDHTVNDALVKIGIIDNEPAVAIQVKSGFVKQDTFAKIIGNWLLSDVKNPVLYVENPITPSCCRTENIDYLVNFFESGKDKNVNSIAYKVYKKYNNYDAACIENDIVALMNSMSITVSTLENLRLESQRKFFDQFCGDIHLFEKAKYERYHRFEDEMFSKIDYFIGQKKACILDPNDIFNIITNVRDQISDKKYVVDENKIKNQKRNVADKLVLEGKLREIKQLFKVKNDAGFVIHEITKELMYKDFRDIYADTQESKLLSNLESEAYSNHQDVYYELENPSPRNDFYATTQRELHSSHLMPESSLFRNGCYIYLTGDNIPDERRISWGGQEDNKDIMD